jgi:hypothetical protein
VTQLLPGKNSNVFDHLGQYGSEQSKTSIASCFVAEGINYCLQASLLVRTLQSFCLHQMDYQTEKNPADSP